MKAGDNPRHVKALVYGPSGIGKTRLIQTLDQAGYKPLVVDINKGLEALEGYVAAGHEIDRIRVEPRTETGQDSTGAAVVKDLTSWEVMQAEFRDHIAGPVRRGEFKYDVIVIDDLTELAKHAIDFVMKSSKSEYPGIGEYGRVSEHLRQFVQYLRDMPVHVYMIALPKTDEDDDGNRSVYPSVQGKLSTEISGYFNVVSFMHIRRVQDTPDSEPYQQRYLLTGMDAVPAIGIVQAKDRFAVLDHTEPADMGAIFNKILGVKTAMAAVVVETEKVPRSKPRIRKAKVNPASQEPSYSDLPATPQV